MAAAKLSSNGARGQPNVVDIKVDTSTIHRRTDCYSCMMCKYATVLRVDTVYQWHIDELFLRVLKKTPVCGNGRRKQVHPVIRDISTQAGLQQDCLLWPRCGHFAGRAYWSVTGSRILSGQPKKNILPKFRPRFVRIREIHLQNLFNQNNIYERLNGECRDRLKCARGLKSNNPTIIRLLIICHNFFREHTSLKDNMAPA